jgi:hypothetical protein
MRPELAQMPLATADASGTNVQRSSAASWKALLMAGKTVPLSHVRSAAVRRFS